MASTPILVFPDWNKEFHVHVDASSTVLGVVLAQPGEGDLDHPISYASRKLSLLSKTKLTKLEFRAQSIFKFNFHFSRRPLFLFLVG